jgi:hypothetical protein
MYQFDPILFHNPDQEFDIDDAKSKLFALMKSPHAIDVFDGSVRTVLTHM